MQKVKRGLVSSRRIDRKRQAMPRSRLDMHIQIRRPRIHLLDHLNIIRPCTIAPTAAIVVLPNDHLKRPLKLGPLRPKPRRQRLKLAHRNSLPNLPRIVQQRRLKGALLQKVELHIPLGRRDHIPGATVGKQLRIVLARELKPPRRDVEPGQRDVGHQEPRGDHAVAVGRVVGDEPDRDERAEGMADVHDLGGLVLGEAGVGGAAGEFLGGADEFSGAGEVGQLAQDLDLDVELHDVVGVGFGGEACSQAVVGEDGVALGECGFDVGVVFGLGFGVPVSGVLLVAFSGMLGVWGVC